MRLCRAWGLNHTTTVLGLCLLLPSGGGFNIFSPTTAATRRRSSSNGVNISSSRSQRTVLSCTQPPGTGCCKHLLRTSTQYSSTMLHYCCILTPTASAIIRIQLYYAPPKCLWTAIYQYVAIACGNHHAAVRILVLSVMDDDRGHILL